MPVPTTALVSNFTFNLLLDMIFGTGAASVPVGGVGVGSVCIGADKPLKMIPAGLLATAELWKT